MTFFSYRLAIFSLKTRKSWRRKTLRYGFLSNTPPTYDCALDFERLGALRSRTDIPMVLHGGSGVAPEMMHRAITMPGGGVSKVNSATDLERALLASLGRETRMSNAECKAIPVDALAPGLRAVEQTVEEKIVHFLQSAGYADRFAS